MVALTTLIFGVIIFVSVRSVDASCSPGWKHYNGTCYLVTDSTEENLDDAKSSCTVPYQYSELIIDDDIKHLTEILSGAIDKYVNKYYWVKCPQILTTNCWVDQYIIDSTPCILFNNLNTSIVFDCSSAYVICRRPENIHRRIRRMNGKGMGGQSNKSSSGSGSNSMGGKSNKTSSGSGSNSRSSTTTSLTTPLTTNSLTTTFLTTTYVFRNTATVDDTYAVTDESLLNISTWIVGQIESQESDPALVFETCNDALKSIDADTSIEIIYQLIEGCEDYALAISDEGVDLYFNFDFLEVAVNTSTNFFGGSFMYSSEEGDTVNLTLTEYSIDEDKGNLTSAVVLLFFKHEGLINLFGKNDSTSLGSTLMAASFAMDGVKKSTEINFSLDTKKNITPSDEYYVCAFWKKDLDEMYWSTHGCETHNNSGEIYCLCNHTTSFGILVTEIPPEHKQALAYITYIGCGFSLAALFITITILMCIPSLNSTRISIHKNFVVSLILAEIVFLVGPLGENEEIICQLITISMHYLWLAVFFWMLMEGVHLYLLVVKVYGSGKSYLQYYVATAWGCPLVVVVVTASLKWQDYKSDSCWLSWENGMIWAFLGPAAAIILVNLLILIRVVCVVVDAVDDGNGKPTKATKTKAAAKGAIVLAPILGTTWLIGVVANIHIVGTYLFTIFNSLQGVFVFVFYCVRNSEVRNSIERIRQKRAIMKSNGKNTSSTDVKSKISNLTPNKDGSINNIPFEMK